MSMHARVALKLWAFSISLCCSGPSLKKVFHMKLSPGTLSVVASSCLYARDTCMEQRSFGHQCITVSSISGQIHDHGTEVNIALFRAVSFLTIERSCWSEKNTCKNRSCSAYIKYDDMMCSLTTLYFGHLYSHLATLDKIPDSCCT